MMEKKDPNFYIEGIGRRKTTTARVRIYPFSEKKDVFLVNDKPYDEYFPEFELRKICEDALRAVDLFKKIKVTVLVKGGGRRGQAEAIRHGLARALEKYKKELRKVLKPLGYLTRDPRMKERKKFGLKKARRAPQWQKR